MYQNPYAQGYGMQAQTYQPSPQFAYQQYQQPQQLRTRVTTVNGPASLMNLPMGPNEQSEAIFDVNGKVFYIVTTDGAAVKTWETFDYAPHAEPQAIEVNGVRFESQEEYDTLVAKVGVALEAINGIHGHVQPAAPAAAAAVAAPAVAAAAAAAPGERPD